MDSQDVFGDEDVMLETETDSENTDGLLGDEDEEDDDHDYHENGRRYRDL